LRVPPPIELPGQSDNTPIEISTDTDTATAQESIGRDGVQLARVALRGAAD
jgi:hypothetical protein